MNRIIQFNVSRDDGTYTAEGVNVPVVTQAESFQELEENIREALTLLFEGEDLSMFGLSPSPTVLTSFELPLELPAIEYGGKA
ncbi:MAG: type II toxin-antitoxin system HicB family antitoxin [Alphaproteobacteria bacterium]|nr:type II toxin-antitoxin system HicB family antitoxin [Alphaproteobacteria bacterium]